MNREQIIQMAREAGIDIDAWEPLYEGDSAGFRVCECTHEELERFAKLVAEHERSECAKVAKTISDKYGWGHYGNEVDTADEIASAIQARGQA